MTLSERAYLTRDPADVAAAELAEQARINRAWRQSCEAQRLRINRAWDAERAAMNSVRGIA